MTLSPQPASMRPPAEIVTEQANDGLDVPYSCQEDLCTPGQEDLCATCRIKVLGGRGVMTP
ncbi:hypothetical protein HEK616_80510 (plasmid) [Streptomyces nigrescens]|uniref:2Fe-2S ferredoxin-type domain-containing protein n=2 Tax=Streptomyces nigrescens TaxID=1920 RepID=A0ABN6R861_STRNI|nr:hypothetical protein HEK616_80510 [Streptomyces nigrescens]